MHGYKRHLLALAALLTLSLSPALAHSSPRGMDALDEIPDDRSNDTPSFSSAWDGGPNTLPYNITISSEALESHAQTLAGVQTAMSVFAQRGYIRRAERDTGLTRRGSSIVVLAYEKPGTDPWVEQPVIVVQSFAAWVRDCGWTPATMISGGLVADSLGYPVVRSRPGDEAIGVVSIVETGSSSGVGTDDVGKTFRAAYAMRELDFGRNVTSFMPRMSADEAAWWGGFGQTVLDAAITGGIAGGVAGSFPGGIGILPGIMIGALANSTGQGVLYVIHHPYPEH